MSTDAERYPQYRWFILGLAWLVLLCLIWGQFLIPSLAYCLFPELKLTQAQFTMILTAPFLVGIFTPVLGGAIGDRFGIRFIITLSAVLSAVFGIARVWAPNFAWMFVFMCLYGIPYGVIMPNYPKLVGIWFPPHQIGLASGIYMSALNIGGALGLLSGPLFGGWKLAFMDMGIVMLAAGVLWAVFSKNAPENVQMQMPPIRTCIQKSIRSKNVWLVAVAQCLYIGAFIGFSGNFPSALEHVHKITPKTAGAIASMLTWGLTIGNFFFPAISDRIGRRKIFVYFGTIVSAICFCFAWYIAPGSSTWILIFIGGIIFGSIQPILFSVLVELPEIGPECMGVASGLVGTLLNAGGFLIPLLVISPLISGQTQRDYTIGFLVTALIIVAVAVLTLFLKETGRRIHNL